jgi:hypothetical protein
VDGRIRADAFTAWLYKEYHELTDNMPFNFSIVRTFTDPREMDNYIRDKDYGKSGFPKLATGIVWKGNDANNYIYSLRQNITNFNSPEYQRRPALVTTPDTNRLFHSYAKNDNDVCLPTVGSSHQGPFENSCSGQYLYNGILTLQRLIGDFIFEDTKAKENGYFVAESGVSFASFPTFEYEKSGFYGKGGGK